ncbi:sensor histidine kinase [Alkalihalobacillus oceani]|uniref:sensor histidine kinase n=1 Tax=Halalkalibacter oceani TaxID=1653776 RepID=UPI00203BC685|nr:sensor histidine kinase [Halalkalibacter oceani]MCM3762971.1 sensor histidine kinase [Halalkalibacter oceani]
MILFLREHFLLILVQVVQFALIFALYWLDGNRNLSVGLYAVFIGLFFLACYLIYHYYSRRMFYKRLSESFVSLEDSIRRTEQSPVSSALDTLLKNQYKHYETKIKKLEHQQEEHLKYIDQWVHQMKTPLSVIELTAQTLDEPDSSNIREETQRMQTGLNTVLYMARLRSIEQDFHIKPVLVTKVVNEVNGENKRFYIRNKVYPKLNVEREGIVVETDEKWLFFIVSQLIQNAVKYSSGKSNSIIISIYERGEEAVLEVKDFGVGIPDVDKKRVYQPFFTGENGRLFRESTGMGLYVTMEAAKHLDHRIELESEQGEGATFRVVFAPTQNLTGM